MKISGNNKIIKFACCFVLLSVCLLSKAQFNAEKDPFLTKNFKDAFFQKINAQTSHGNITVSMVPAAESRIEVYARPGNYDERNMSKEEIQQRLDENYTLEIAVANGQLNAIAKQKNPLSIGKKTLSFSFIIYAPQNVSSTLKTSHGNIALSGLTGSQDVSTSHGNLSIEAITGKLTAETSHGNISISGSREDMDLRTSHGNIEAKNCAGTIKLVTSQGNLQLTDLKGNIRVRTDHGDVTGETIEGELSATTSHGNVNLKNLSCSVETSTSHGNINVAVTQLTGRITIGNSKGDIALQIPKGKGVDLNLQGKEISTDAMENFSGSKETHLMKGNINGGGIAIKATTGKGRVSLVFR